MQPQLPRNAHVADLIVAPCIDREIRRRIDQPFPTSMDLFRKVKSQPLSECMWPVLWLCSIARTITGFTTGNEVNFPIEQRADISAVGHSWEFPAAVQYRFFKSSVRPYVEGGISFNHLGNVYDFASANASFFSPTPRQPPFTIAPVGSSFERVGWLFGMGVDLKLHVIHVTPGLRYTHYNEKNFWLPSTNAVDFLVGFTF